MNLPPPPPPISGAHPNIPPRKRGSWALRGVGTWFGVFFLVVFVDVMLTSYFPVPWDDDVSSFVGFVLATAATFVTVNRKRN